MLSDVPLLLALILVNGVFAMAEMAVVSSRRARLLQIAERGTAGAGMRWRSRQTLRDFTC
jgi:putative hemolysin